MKTLFFGVLLLATLSVSAQQGFVRGKVTDGETGEGLYGATIVKTGTAEGIVADFDGNYSLALEPGTHSITVTFISYQTQTIENVEVKAGQVTSLDIVLSSDVTQLGEIVVSGQAMRDTESAILTFQRKSPNLLDGISNQTFRKTGDRDLASAIGRVTGVSVQSGKFVYVRGLGDRYTRTTLNGMAIPGLDPDRNDVQIDIFPTSVLENVVVYKTFSPDLPGDFTGGIVDVETKSFPEEKTTSVSLGFRYNPEMNLINDFLSYKGGNTDWLGFDDGTRELPFSPDTPIPNEVLNDPKLETLTRSFNPQLGVQRKNSFLNTQFAFNHGNQVNRDRYTLGYSAIFNYQNSFEHYGDVEFGEYTKDDNADENPLFVEEVRKGELSRFNVLWSGLLTGSIKYRENTLTGTLFRTQNGVSEASDRLNSNYDETQAVLYENILTYSQRSVTSGSLSGTHQLGALRVSWKNALTFARTYDPDFRSTSISISDPTNPNLFPGDGAGIRRFWRDLNEFNENLRVDLSLPLNNKAHKLSFGAAGLYKDRTFDVFSYTIEATERSNVPLDPNYFLQPENIWTDEEQEGSFVRGGFEEANNYAARSSVFAAYAMSESTFGKLKAVYGLRVEKADMFYTGADIFGNDFDNDHTLDELNVLPSLNLVYGLSDMTNLRLSYGRTLARPSFREKSSASIYDPITKRFFNGNLDLEQTTIDNFDLRWEKFYAGGEMFSVSGFYKKFQGHIEMVTFDVAPNNVRPRNAGDSYVYGVELEARRNIGFVNGLSIGANVTLAKSSVDIKSIIVNESGTTEYESRVFNARTDETIDDTRPMAGQSPYLINGFLNYADQEGTFNANLSYNVQGESLFIVGIGAVPDIYTQPFHSLNLNVSKNFGVDNRHRVSVGMRNILDSDRVDLYKNYPDQEAVYSIFRPGRTFSLTYGLTF